MQKDTHNLQQLALFIIAIGLLLFSCKDVTQTTTEKELIFKTYCYDTSIVWIYTDKEANDTLFRLDCYPGTGKRKAKDGHWIIYYDKAYTKKAYEVSVKNGKEIGTYTSWRRNGTKKYEGSCIGDIQYGYYREWYSNNILKREEYKRNDTIIGTVKSYYCTGKLKCETFYVKNRIYKTLSYDERGKIISILYYKASGPHYYQNDKDLEVNFNTNGEIEKTYKYYLDTTEDVNTKSEANILIVRSNRIDLGGIRKMSKK